MIDVENIFITKNDFVKYALHTIKTSKFKSDTGANKTELKLNILNNKN